MLPEANYVRFQPLLRYQEGDKVLKFECDDAAEDFEKMCEITCQYLQENQDLVQKALSLII